MTNILNTGVRNAHNVIHYTIGTGAITQLSKILEQKRVIGRPVVYFIDQFFSDDSHFLSRLNTKPDDLLIFVPTQDEPTTDFIDAQVDNLHNNRVSIPSAIIGIGGGITMDVAKAISNLLTNGGKAKDYQGWDLVKKPGIYKIAVPTISGTGSEATRTCVMTNKKTKLKLGMNSDYTVYDQIIMDPDLTITVPYNQYFYTGMDAFIHCFEALGGAYRNPIGDAFSEQTLNLCQDIFTSDDMMDHKNRANMMVASYLGGCAIATSYVGVVHPFSAGLSVVLGTHHCIANCITMRAMEEFYPEKFDQFWQMVEKQGVKVPEGICSDLTDEQYEQLYASTIVHEKPLTNALGEDFKKILTKEKVIEIFKKM